MSDSKKKSTELSATSPELQFRKTNEAIGLRVSEGRLSLLSRKIFNVMVFHAQKKGEPGKDAPIDTEVAKKYYWIPLGDLAHDAAYDSKDTELIKEHIHELQNVKLIMEDDKQWTSERLVSSVKIVNPAGLKKKGGKLWIGFTFPPEVASLVLNPGAYTKLSIYYQTLFRSGSSLALYEVCRRYATNPSHLTSKEPWLWWLSVLSGNPISENFPEYKYFKRDLMKPAIAEINAVTDIKVELIEFKQGRKIVDLQFKVYPCAQQSLELPGQPVVDGALIGRLIQLGINQKDASDLYVSTDEALLRATLKLVEERIQNRNLEPISHQGAYFRTVLRKGYAKDGPGSMLAVGNSTPKVLGGERSPTLREKYTAKTSSDAEGYYHELDESERNVLLQDFIVVAPTAILSYLKKSGLKTKIAKASFLAWLAIRLWGEPSEKELLKFAEDTYK